MTQPRSWAPGLFAVLTASLLVALGVSIFGISLKELMIATFETQSQTAYYAADSAEECAEYWDLKMGAFPACLDSGCPSDGNISTSTTNTIVCNGNTIQLNFIASSTAAAYTEATSTFFAYGTSFGSANPEASITIIKNSITSPTTGQFIIQTTIDAQGHDSGIVGNRVERGISETYNQ